MSPVVSSGLTRGTFGLNIICSCVKGGLKRTNGAGYAAEGRCGMLNGSLGRVFGFSSPPLP